jgi:aerobic C4-dicarboxylate transport protein
VQVLIGVALGIVVGGCWPETGAALKPLGDAFIKLVKMLVPPIIFCTVVHGIASLGDFKKLGRIGWKTLLYFELVSTLALLIGLLVVNVMQPGAGFVPHVTDEQAKQAAEIAKQAHSLNPVDFLLHLIPDTFLSPLVNGDVLQVLLVAILTAVSLTFMGERGAPILRGIEHLTQLLFVALNLIVRLAPIGAFGAMSYTVGHEGLVALKALGLLMVGFYATAALFVVVVLGLIARCAGFSIFRFIAYIKDELFLVLGTSSSETALPGIIDKMKRLGCAKSTVELVIPTGYSFNLDGTSIYLSMAVGFLAQATHTPLDWSQQLTLLAVAMLTSKGSAAVTGGGFITLSATIAAVPSIPVDSPACVFGIDRFMSECRALTNLIGNGVATVVISRWEGELNSETLRNNLLASGDENRSSESRVDPDSALH